MRRLKVNSGETFQNVPPLFSHVCLSVTVFDAYPHLNRKSIIRRWLDKTVQPSFQERAFSTKLFLLQ